tara:strand:+ start:1286 stop:1714 length:429 start_codon:yes stop_codon:yes gene_type:complete
MKFFLNFLESIGRKRVIPDRLSNEPYLTRYYLFLKERKVFPFNIFLHNFHKGDPDDLHDHPWPFITFILKGGYWEHTPTGRYWRAPGTVRFARSGQLHRVELEPGVDVWTLFIPGPKLKEWGFIDKGIWKHHKKYLSERYKG